MHKTSRSSIANSATFILKIWYPYRKKEGIRHTCIYINIYIYKYYTLYKPKPQTPTASRWSTPSACKRALLRRVPRRGCKLWAFNFLSTLASCPVDSHAVFSPTSRGSCRATSSSKSRKGFLGCRGWENPFLFTDLPNPLNVSLQNAATQIIWVWLFLACFPIGLLNQKANMTHKPVETQGQQHIGTQIWAVIHEKQSALKAITKQSICWFLWLHNSPESHSYRQCLSNKITSP